MKTRSTHAYTPTHICIPHHTRTHALTHVHVHIHAYAHLTHTLTAHMRTHPAGGGVCVRRWRVAALLAASAAFALLLCRPARGTGRPRGALRASAQGCDLHRRRHLADVLQRPHLQLRGGGLEGGYSASGSFVVEEPSWIADLNEKQARGETPSLEAESSW
jgi:hypothetical protein